MSAFCAGVTALGSARRHRDADALEQIADRQVVPVAHEIRAGQRRREAVAGQIVAVTLGARGLVRRRAALRLFLREHAVPHGFAAARRRCLPALRPEARYGAVTPELRQNSRELEASLALKTRCATCRYANQLQRYWPQVQDRSLRHRV